MLLQGNLLSNPTAASHRDGATMHLCRKNLFIWSIFKQTHPVPLRHPAPSVEKRQRTCTGKKEKKTGAKAQDGYCHIKEQHREIGCMF